MPVNSSLENPSGEELDTSANQKMKSLRKSLRLLECFIDTPELSLTELAGRLGIYKSNASDILSALCDMGYASKNPDNGKYRLGFKILELSHSLTSLLDYRRCVYPVIKELAASTGETVYFGIPDGLRVLYLDVAYPERDFSPRSMLGESAPLYCTGIGKALLSLMGEEDWKKAVESPLKSFTPNTITDPSALFEELKLTKKRGWSLDNMEHEFGIRCVGAAARTVSGRLVAISVSGPSPRFDEAFITEYSGALIDSLRGLAIYL